MGFINGSQPLVKFEMWHAMPFLRQTWIVPLEIRAWILFPQIEERN